jgi:hypothetical protein
MELAQIQAVHTELKDRYREVRAAAEARVVEQRYTAGFRVNDLEPFSFERGGLPRPRLLRKAPAHAAVEHGLDAAGAIVLVRQVDRGWLGQEWYRVDGQRSVAYEKQRSSSRILTVRAHLQEFADGRLSASGRFFTGDRGRSGWRIERYGYDDGGRLVEVRTSHPPQDELGGATGDMLDRLEYDARGRLRLVHRFWDGGGDEVTFIKLDRSLPKELAALADDVVAALAAALDRAGDDARALALTYADGQYDIAFFPMLLRDEDWRAWREEPLELALNPAEWDREDEIALPPELEERRRLLQVAVSSRGADGRAWLLDVARRLNALGPEHLFTYAIDAPSDRFEEDLAAVLAPDRIAALRRGRPEEA